MCQLFHWRSTESLITLSSFQGICVQLNHLYRVVIVNESGEKVMDTMVKVEDPMMIMIKPGKKQAIVEAMS